ncbi:Rv3235 family protein [Saccharopolyspora sp. ID03-671]|uniref:Rv3235 family protein n=1 Tax=Saccharopolyspora sp. ID03-671 TaxID=3073066 RepID=UPI00324F8196
MTAIQGSTAARPRTTSQTRTTFPPSPIARPASAARSRTEPPPGPRDAAQRSATAVASMIGRQVFDVLAGRTRADRVRESLTATVFGNLIGVRLHGAGHPDYRLHSVHACAVGDSVVEACLIVGAHRFRALVLRIERQAQRWVCTRLSPIERSAF